MKSVIIGVIATGMMLSFVFGGLILVDTGYRYYHGFEDIADDSTDFGFGFFIMLYIPCAFTLAIPLSVWSSRRIVNGIYRILSFS